MRSAAIHVSRPAIHMSRRAIGANRAVIDVNRGATGMCRRTIHPCRRAIHVNWRAIRVRRATIQGCRGAMQVCRPTTRMSHHAPHVCRRAIHISFFIRTRGEAKNSRFFAPNSKFSRTHPTPDLARSFSRPLCRFPAPTLNKKGRSMQITEADSFGAIQQKRSREKKRPQLAPRAAGNQPALPARSLGYSITSTRVPISAASKKCFAIVIGIRMQPCEARKRGTKPACIP